MAYEPAAARPTRRVIFVTNPAFHVDIYMNMSWGDRKALRELIANMDKDDEYFTKSSDVMALRLIKDWNLDDAKANKLPITQESLDALDERDHAVIMDAIAPVISPSQTSEDEKNSKKKTSTSKSEQLSPTEEKADPSPSNS